MSEILLAALAVVWLIGAWLRIYRQARFYQIEEYMSGRYLRWVLARPLAIAPARPIAAWILGLAIGSLLAEAPDGIVPQIIAVIAAIVAVIPPRQRRSQASLRRHTKNEAAAGRRLAGERPGARRSACRLQHDSAWRIRFLACLCLQRNRT